MKQKHNHKLIPNTNVTVKEFKELIFENFKAYPLMYTDYKKNRFIISNTFYDNISITQRKLSLFCKKLNIKHELSYEYSRCVIIDLN